MNLSSSKKNTTSLYKNNYLIASFDHLVIMRKENIFIAL
jgi:hypothetical protein